MTIKIRLFRIKINKSGYDATGQYWGIGLPLYHYEFELDNYIEQFDLRAENRNKAKDLVKHWMNRKFPNIRFSFYR
jgi:hypothetical protein